MPGMMDMIGLGILLRWKDEATAGMRKAEIALGSLSDASDEAEKKTAKVQASFAKLGKVGAVITGFGVAGAATMYGLARAASTFEDSLRSASAVTGLAGEALVDMERDLGEAAMSLSERFGVSAAEVTRSFLQVITAGAKAGTEDFAALSESALMLARVVGGEPAAAVESLSDTLNSFGLSLSSARRMADVFFKTSVLGGASLGQVTDSMNEASRVAAEMGVPIEDVAAVLAGFASKGLKGTKAGMAFRMLMTKLAAPADDAADALARLGVAVYDADTRAMRPIIDILGDLKRGLSTVTHEEREAALRAIAGEESFARLGAVVSIDTATLKGWSAELGRGGALQAAFGVKAETLSFAFAGARESLRNVAVELGKHLLPILKPVGQAVAWLAGKVGEFLRAHPIITKFAVGLGAAATAAALVVGPVIMIAGLVGALGGIPVILGAVTAGFASLGAAAALVGGAISAAFWPVTLVAITKN